MSRKLALIIGNMKYTDPGLAQLTAPGKDAEDLARVLNDKDICAFDDVRVIVNEPSGSVIESIDEFFDQKKPDDLLVLYFSGHGIRDEIGSLYLAFKNTIRSRLRSTAIKSDYIKEAMDQSRSKRQVLILDCCNSGAFPQGTKAELGGSMGMTQAFQGYGRFVLTASDATQFAWEGDKVIGETDNSLFTHFLVKGLEGEADSDGDGRITVDELYDYAFDEISRVTPKQTPTKSASKQEGEIILRQNMRIEDIKPVPLPTALLDSVENPFPDIRLGAVQQLIKLLKGKNLGLARSAREVLERIEQEDDSRQVSRAAAQALEPIRQAEALAKQKDAEALLAEREKEAQRVAQEAEIQRLLHERTVEAERLEREKAEKYAAQKAEEERIAKAKLITDRSEEEKRRADEQAQAERKVKDAAERLAVQKAEEERLAKAKLEARRLANEKRRAQVDKTMAYLKQVKEQFVGYLQSIPSHKPRAVGFSALAIMALTGFMLYQQLNNNSFYFSGPSNGNTSVYLYAGEQTGIVQDMGSGENWSPAVGAFGKLYFTSNRDGKAEIYELKSNNDVERLTHTPDPWESWSPAIGAFGRLFFTSNRDGKAEIYELKSNGDVERLTHTPDPWESWSPAVDVFGRIYFTSNRDGKAEIYEFERDGSVKRVTQTPNPWESWSPGVSTFGRLFFTSNRDGKAEIYELTRDGEIRRYTYTPDSAESWSPVVRGQDIYFTSNRDGHNRVYNLIPQATIIVPYEGWTTRRLEKIPYSSP